MLRVFSNGAHLPFGSLREFKLFLFRKNEKLLDGLKRMENGDKLLKMCIERSYPNLLYIFDGEQGNLLTLVSHALQIKIRY